MRRIFVILFVSVYLFVSSFVYPREQAKAVVPLALLAAEAGFEVGVGAYVLGGLAVAGLGTAIGLQNADAIKSYSVNVWKSANQNIKDSLKASVIAAVQAGSSVIHLSSDVYNFVRDAVKAGVAYFQQPSNVKISSSSGLSDYVGNYGWGSTISLSTVSGYRFLLYSSVLGQYYLTSSISAQKLSDGRTRVYDSANGTTLHYSDTYFSDPYIGGYTETNIKNVMNAFSSVGVVLSIVPSTYVLPNVPDIPTGLDNIYVPAEDVKAYPIENGVVGTQPLTWNDTTKVWQKSDGTTWTGSISWDFPIPNVAENGKVVVGDTVAVGEGVGTQVGTQSGTQSGTGEGAGATDGVLGDILTGVQTIADVLTTGLVGDTSKINWDKLKMAGSAFTTAFPFSIPWDIGRAFDAVFGSFDDLRDMPAWDWHIHFAGQDYTIHFKVDDYFLGWFGILRDVMLIMFDVGLVYAVRKMLGGAS